MPKDARLCHWVDGCAVNSEWIPGHWEPINDAERRNPPMLDLEAIDARWKAVSDEDGYPDHWSVAGGDCAYIVGGDYISEGEPDIGIVVEFAEDPQAVADAIAHSRQDVPALVGEVRRLLAKITAVRELEARLKRGEGAELWAGPVLASAAAELIGTVADEIAEILGEDA